MKLTGGEWSRADAIAIMAILVAIVLAGISVFTQIATPEVRRAMGLDPPEIHPAPIIDNHPPSLLNAAPAKPRTVARTASAPTAEPSYTARPSEEEIDKNSSPQVSSAVAKTAPALSKAPIPFSVEDNLLFFVIKNCVRLDKTLSCSGAITNRADKRRGVTIGFNATAVDELGNQYSIGEYQAILGIAGNNQQLEPDLPVNFTLVINNVDPTASHISIVLGYAADSISAVLPYVNTKAVFRNVAITMR